MSGRVHIRIKPDEKKELQEIAEKSGMNLSVLIKIELKKLINKYRKTNV